MDERQKIKVWLAAWKRAAPVIERDRYEMQKRMTAEHRYRVIDDLLALGVAHRRPREDSGLVHQQALFRRSRR